MQKQVSKQSLAIVALSILLAISMALTATFAAFSASAKATGTITFAGGLSIAWSGAVNDGEETPGADANGVLVDVTNNAAATVALSEAAFVDNGNGAFILSATVKNATGEAAEFGIPTVTITSAVAKDYYYAILVQDNVTNAVVSVSETYQKPCAVANATNNGKIEVLNKTVSNGTQTAIVLKNIITEITLSGTVTNATNFVVKCYAAYSKTELAGLVADDTTDITPANFVLVDAYTINA